MPKGFLKTLKSPLAGPTAAVHRPVSKQQQYGLPFVHAAHVKSMATDQYAHLVLVTALSRVDDTALLRKNIITELQVRRNDHLSPRIVCDAASNALSVLATFLFAQ